MKITGVKTFIVDGVFRPWTFVKVETDSGIVGWGDCTEWQAAYSVAATVDQLAPRRLLPTASGNLLAVGYCALGFRGSNYNPAIMSGAPSGSSSITLNPARWYNFRATEFSLSTVSDISVYPWFFARAITSLSSCVPRPTPRNSGSKPMANTGTPDCTAPQTSPTSKRRTHAAPAYAPSLP